MQKTELSFSTSVMNWFVKNGRHGLPWQKNPTGYRVWLSEVMLQQTQVKTVIPYYEKFTEKFSSVSKLAKADLDQVLHLWTGLGYYTRARNLHKTANLIVEKHNSKFPDEVRELEQLPGIGKSTAGAIVSLAYNKKAPILDGNVKRVLSRYHAISAFPNSTKAISKLWTIAEKSLPNSNFRSYTQAMMDLGATVCTRSNPLCEKCPIAIKCTARIQNKINDFPGKKQSTIKKTAEIFIIIIENRSQQLLLIRRPPKGIWGGLWSFPEFSSESEANNEIGSILDSNIQFNKNWKAIEHKFSHFKLIMRPKHYSIEDTTNINGKDDIMWVDKRKLKNIGVPAPVLKILENREETIKETFDDRKSYVHQT